MRQPAGISEAKTLKFKTSSKQKYQESITVLKGTDRMWVSLIDSTSGAFTAPVMIRFTFAAAVNFIRFLEMNS